MKIGNKDIGLEYQPFIIAEMSGNHNQSMERALKIVEAAAKTGAHALKLQTYTADTITLDVKERDFYIDDKDNLWRGKNLHELYNQAHTPWDWHQPIIQLANDLGMVCFSSPFDESAVDFLEDLNVPAYKIASFENNHLPLIRKVASTDKPLIISTGMASIAEIDEAVCSAREAGCKDLALLKCTSTYPASPEHSDILTIPHMRKMFNCEVGLSDHTMGNDCALAAVAMGASVIEKHVTFDNELPGPDHKASITIDKFSDLVKSIRNIEIALGDGNKNISKEELEVSKMGRKSIVSNRKIKKGEIISKDMICYKRPGSGYLPIELDKVMGKKAGIDIEENVVIRNEHLL